MCSIPGLPSSGSNVPVLLSRINLNPSCVLIEFWGNFDEERKFEYQQLKKEIQCPREGFCEADGNPGDFCLVHVYETWYRARIVSRDAEDYSVFLIDEGRTLRATVSTLAWGKSDFFYLPPEVEFCVLANVLPLSPENKWTTMALEFMRTFCGRRVNAFVQDVLVPHRTFLLDIPCLSRQMYEMGFAKKLSSDRFKEFVAKSLQSNSGVAEHQRISSIRSKAFDLAKQMEKPQSYMYPELQTDTVETVVITEVTSPCRIFCQLKVFSQELRKLTEHLTQHYEGRVVTNFARPENLGSPCASRGSDGKWYRSVLQQVMSTNNVVEVLHVDYGKKQFVQAENVRPLVSEFFRMPVVTYLCCLHGIVDRGPAWTPSQIDYLKSLLLNRTMIAKFQYQSLSEGVHYVTLYGEENTNINQLFELKQKVDTDLTLADFAVQRSPSSQKSNVSEKNEIKCRDATHSDLKGNKPVFFQETLPPLTSHVAVVQHVESPGKFWVQTQRYASEFDRLMNDLEHLYSDSTSTEGLIRKPVAGLLCAAKALDGVFYRATVYKIVDKEAEVFFLDYGNTELVDCCNLRQLPLRFQQLPAVAVKCCLCGVKPKLKQWDETATSFFSKMVDDKVLDLHVQDKLQDTHMVQLVDSSLDGENDIGKLLCRAGLAETEEVVEKSAVRSCSLKMAHGAIAQSKTSSSSSVVTESASAFKEYLFPIGSSLEVTVSYIESPNDFWCQKAKNGACLELLMQDMQSFYAHSEFQPPLEAACVARHPKTGLWYRALIIQKHQTPHVDALFVDYGQMMKVAIEDLRKISPAFLKMKGQAFRCSLYNLIHPVSHSTLDWSPEATTVFQEFVDTAASANVPLKCTIFAVMYDSQKVVFNVVDLETPFQSICNLLVQRHLADGAPSKRAPVPPFRLDTYYYSSHGIKTGCDEKVSVTCVKSATQFFCHLARNSDEIEKLASKVNSLCQQLEVTKCPRTFGTVCFVRFTDGLWYRGQIKSIQPVVVHFVDYGDTLEVDKSALLPVPIEAGEIMTVPVQAVECGLSDIPDDVPGEVGRWFQNYVEGCSFRALIVAKEPGGKLLVELYDGKTQVNALIRQKFRNEIPRNEQSAYKEHNSKNKSVAAQGRERSNDPRRNNTVPQSSESHLARRVNDSGSKQSRWGFHKDGGSEPQKDVRRCHYASQLHEPQRNDGDQWLLPPQSREDGVKTKPQTSLKESDLPLKSITPGLESSVFISHCISPSSFFVQLAEDEDEIYSLVEKLNDDQLKREAVDGSDVSEGHLVCAVFPDDNSWYRAAVRKKTDDTVDVEFVDFGNTAVVSLSKICHLNSLFALFPRYSIHCSLNNSNVDGTDQGIAPDFKQVIEQNVDKVTCTFVKLSGAVWDVKLHVNGVVLGSTCEDESPPAAELQSPSVKVMCDISEPTFYKNPDLSVGQMVTGYGSYIKGPWLFWCQYSTTDKLEEVSGVLQSVGNALEKPVQEVPVGSSCIALFSEDNLWYRAKVTSRDHDTLSVTFIDYGNESKVNMDEVKTLPPQVSDVPPQAFDCQLEGFDLSKGVWDEKADDVFYELINDKLLKLTIRTVGTSETPHNVWLECDGVVINDVMQKYWKSSENSSVDFLNQEELLTCDDLVADERRIGQKVTCEMHADDDNVSSSDMGLVPSKAQDHLKFTQDPEHAPVADVTGSLSDSSAHHDSEETLITPLSHHTAEAQQGAESNSSSENLDASSEIGVLQQTADSKPCVEEPESPLCEIIWSDLGYLRRAVEMKPVGSECVIWSHARKRWCRSKILKVTEDATLVLLVEHDSEVLVDPLNIFEILPGKTLQPACVGAAVSGDELTRTGAAAPVMNISQAENAGFGQTFTSASEKPDDIEGLIPEGQETRIRPGEQKTSGAEAAEQLQARGDVLLSGGLQEDSEVVEETSEAGSQMLEPFQIQSVPECVSSEHLQTREPRRDINTAAAEHREGEAKMNSVDLLLDFLDDVHDKVQDETCRTDAEINALYVTEDPILTSDGTLQDKDLLTEDNPHAEETSRLRDETCDRSSSETHESGVTHLTLSVDDSDDVIFVGVLQEAQGEV